MTQSPPPVRRTRKAEQRADTMEQIHDAAEELFSKHGLHGTTLKDVAKQVGVHHTLLNYYFADKKALFDAVLARRAVVTSERRMRALNDYEAACAGAPTVEGALHAFLDTDLDTYIEGGEGWKNYAKLGAQVANTPEWGAELMSEHFDPVVLRLIDLLRKALPDADERDIFWGYHFVTGALMLTLARTGRIDKLSGGLCRSEDFLAVKQRMATFMAAGLRSICDREAAMTGPAASERFDAQHVEYPGLDMQEAIMGEFTDKLDAAGNKIAGKAKELFGDATDNPDLEAEGDAQQLKGTGQDVKGSVKGALGDKI